MKNYLRLLILTILLFATNACQPDEEIARDENHLKVFLHQKQWQVTAMTAVPSDSSTTQDWYAWLPDCVRDNVFITEAPGTGVVGEIHAEENAGRCASGDLSYRPHIAGWKLNDTHDIFSVDLFDTGHRMLYGYELEPSYHTENWRVDILDEQIWQVQVRKIRDSAEYDVILRFQSIP
ncbi:hypothetical protein [Tunicatimonas pelagia]|uniref:hypothetical protein n=1 Tax=Tunicatimonas pelagia TaxID=931531 RepID=UPI002664E860|nr:hypothetical protein [Tunicatimonas pelagia]WKN44928.1 hypothetical protein P0M28_08125 [Tunicatimonas pelagia]